MTLLQGIILGLLQGIAEFLPISSSGHLALMQKFFNIQEGNLFFTEMLHFGTFLSIFVVYFKDIMLIIIEFINFFIRGFKTKNFVIRNRYQKLAFMILIASVPTAIIGLSFEDFFNSLYSGSIIPIGISFIITGVLLWIGDKGKYKNKDIREMTSKDSLIIGTMQGIAIVPGISRSGTTIVASLIRGLDRETATMFSFLLALPAIFGAGILGIKDALKADLAHFNPPIIIGMFVAFITGIIALRVLINILKKDKLYYFSYYLWIIGIITILSSFF